MNSSMNVLSGRCRNKTFKWFKRIYRVFKYDGWRSSEYWLLQSEQKKKNFNCVLIAETMTNKEFQAIIKELFIRYRKINISLVFITQFYFSVSKDVRLNSTH